MPSVLNSDSKQGVCCFWSITWNPMTGVNWFQCFCFLNNCTALYIFFNQKNKSHVSRRETRYLQALFWVSGPQRIRVLMTKQGGRLGPGNRNEVGVCVCLWPPWTRSVLRGDHHSWVREGTQSPEWGPWPGHTCGPMWLFPPVAGLQRQGWDPECRCGSIPMFSWRIMVYLKFEEHWPTKIQTSYINEKKVTFHF